MEQEIQGKNKRYKNFISPAKDAGGGSGAESGDGFSGRVQRKIKYREYRY